jgi:CBS domain-containing protein
MLVKDIMKKEVISVKKSTTLAELLEKFKEFHTFPLIPVVDELSRLIGTVSLKNIIELFEPTKTNLLKSVPFIEHHEVDIFTLEIPPEMKNLYVVDDMMETKFLTVNEDDTLEKAYSFMRLHNIEKVLVINRERKLVGILGMFDIVHAVFVEKGLL